MLPAMNTAFRHGRRRLGSSGCVVSMVYRRGWLSDAKDQSNESASKVTREKERPWTWSTPSPVRPGRGSPELPLKPRVPLTVEEVTAAIESEGAKDVRVVDMRQKNAGMGDYMIFSTANSVSHMRRLADMIVYALKKRKLRQAVGITGAEGYDSDDWVLVDCDNLIVHFMLHDTREELALEDHWNSLGPDADPELKRKREEMEREYLEEDDGSDEEEVKRGKGRGTGRTKKNR